MHEPSQSAIIVEGFERAGSIKQNKHNKNLKHLRTEQNKTKQK